MGITGGALVTMVLLLLVTVLVAGVCYWTSLRLHPYSTCRRCDGSGKRQGTFFTHAYRTCRHCAGAGRRLRLGLRFTERE